MNILAKGKNSLVLQHNLVPNSVVQHIHVMPTGYHTWLPLNESCSTLSRFCHFWMKIGIKLSMSIPFDFTVIGCCRKTNIYNKHWNLSYPLIPQFWSFSHRCKSYFDTEKSREFKCWLSPGILSFVVFLLYPVGAYKNEKMSNIKLALGLPL